MNAILAITGVQFYNFNNFLSDQVTGTVKQRVFVISDMHDTQNLDWTETRLNLAKRQEQAEIEKFALMILKNFGNKLTDIQKNTLCSFTHRTNMFDSLNTVDLKMALLEIRDKLLPILKTLSLEELEALNITLRKDYESGVVSHLALLGRVQLNIERICNDQTLGATEKTSKLWQYMEQLKTFSDPETAENLYTLFINSEYEQQSVRIVVEIYGKTGMWTRALKFVDSTLHGKISNILLTLIMKPIFWQMGLEKAVKLLSGHQVVESAAFKIIISEISERNRMDSTFQLPLTFERAKTINNLCVHAARIGAVNRSMIYEAIMNFILDDIASYDKDVVEACFFVVNQIDVSKRTKVLQKMIDYFIKHDKYLSYAILELFAECFSPNDRKDVLTDLLKRLTIKPSKLL